MLGRASDLFLTDPDDYTLDPEGPESEQVTEAATILVICVLIVVCNVLVIWAVATAPGPKEAIDLYVLSVAIADLLCGVFIVPLSVYPAIVKEWVCITNRSSYKYNWAPTREKGQRRVISLP